MLELGRLAKRGHGPVQIPQPFVQIRIPGPDILDVALEMLHVHGVEAHDGRVQPYIGLGDLVAEVEGARGFCEVCLGAIEAREQFAHVVLVCLLGGGEARLVHAVVDVVVRPGVCLVDFVAEPLRVQVDVAVGRLELFGQQVVELGVQHTDDLGGLVGHDGLLLLVPEDRHGEARGVVAVRGEIEVAQVCEVRVQGLRGGVFAGDVFVGRGEAPALIRSLSEYRNGMGMGMGMEICSGRVEGGTSITKKKKR